MRYLRYALVVIFGLALFLVAFANRDPIEVRLLPEPLARLTGFSLATSLPLFITLFLALMIGAAVGLIWEWARNHRYRARANRSRREAEELQRELGRVKGAPPASEADEVLKLLDAKP